MIDKDIVFEYDEDIIENRKRQIREALKIPGAKVRGDTVIRRLPNGVATVESVSSFLNKFPGRI